VARACDDREVATAGTHRVAIADDLVRVPRIRCVADEVPKALVGVDHGVGDAVVAHQGVGEPPVRLRPLGVVLAVCRRPVERRDART
jgi:hypothetical protein